VTDNLCRIPGLPVPGIAGTPVGQRAGRGRQEPLPGRRDLEGVAVRRAAGRIPSAFFGWDLGRNDHTDELDERRPAEPIILSSYATTVRVAR
jgi:hypothetical protein